MDSNKVSFVENLNPSRQTVVQEPVSEPAAYTHSSQAFPPLPNPLSPPTQTLSPNRHPKMSTTQILDFEKRLSAVELLAAENKLSAAENKVSTAANSSAIETFREMFVKQDNTLSQLMSALKDSNEKWRQTNQRMDETNQQILTTNQQMDATNQQILAIVKQTQDIKISTQTVSANCKDSETKFVQLSKQIEKQKLNTASQFNTERKRFLKSVIFEENSAFRVMPIKTDNLFYTHSVFNTTSPPHINVAKIVASSPLFHQIDKTLQAQIVNNFGIGYVKIDAHFANPTNKTKGFTVYCSSPRMATAIKSLLRSDPQTKVWTLTQIRSKMEHLNKLRKICHDAISPLQSSSSFPPPL